MTVPADDYTINPCLSITRMV